MNWVDLGMCRCAVLQKGGDGKLGLGQMLGFAGCVGWLAGWLALRSGVGCGVEWFWQVAEGFDKDERFIIGMQREYS